MSLFNQFIGIISIFSCFTLTGCGFQPLYGPASMAETDKLGHIKIARIDNREGQILRNHLLDVLNPYGEPAQPLYRLNVSLKVSETGFSFRKDSTPSRTIMTSKASFSLLDLSSNKVIYKDLAEATTSFGIGAHADQAVFPAVTSMKKETERAMGLLAQEIKLQLATFLASAQQPVSQSQAKREIPMSHSPEF